MNCRSIPERDDWFLTDRKPTICPRCGKKEVKKWKQAGHTVLSFFVNSGYEGEQMPRQFPEMFGKESAKAINVTNIIKLARELNKTWAVKA